MNQTFKQTIPFTRNPVDLLHIFKDEQQMFFLDSSLKNSRNGRCSYFGFSPLKRLRAKNFIKLREMMLPYKGDKKEDSFLGGAVGIVGYDADMSFGIYETLGCIDHHKKTLTVSSRGLPFIDKRHQKKAAQQKIDYILSKIQNYQQEAASKKNTSAGKLVIKSNTTRAQYVSAVKRALEHIYDGDIYQINLAHRFDVKINNWKKHVHPIEIYKHLRVLSPSTFSAYLDDGQRIVLSSSPERFLRFAQGIAEVSPMKGTRPRGRTKQEDQAYLQELLNSEKEKAELLMVTDLERNDLGRVCRYGSVKVKSRRAIEKYATVFQATSKVTGKLRRDCDQFDLLESTFPSGSVTGCPKIEAMKIIQQLEKSHRGLYTGALGYIGFSGQMDFNVLIRTMFMEHNKISFYVGSGIVADSNPQKEYEETLIKANAMMEALRRSFKSI